MKSNSCVCVTGTLQQVRYEDVELGSLEAEEPETWSETVDKKTLKKMHPKDVKRQDTIWGKYQMNISVCCHTHYMKVYMKIHETRT